MKQCEILRGVSLEKAKTSRLSLTLERFSRAGPRGRGSEWATLGEHPLTWLLSNNRLEKVPFVSVLHTSSNRLLLSNQDKGCTPSVAHSLPLPLGPALLNLWTMFMLMLNIFESPRLQSYVIAQLLQLVAKSLQNSSANEPFKTWSFWCLKFNEFANCHFWNV